MKVAIDHTALQGTLQRIHGLLYGFALFLALGLLGELFSQGMRLGLLFWGIVLSLSFKSLRQVLLNFQYSFWSFALGFAIYLVFSMLGAESSLVTNCYLLALALLAWLCATVSSPLFYPRITWWEYDFRFRGELKINAHLSNQCIVGRLTDLRREAGCVVLFEKLSSGTEFNIDYKHGEETNTYLVKVMSQRSSTMGRGYTYGVKFLFSANADRNNFQRLCHLWKTIKRAKRRAKF